MRRRRAILVSLGFASSCIAACMATPIEIPFADGGPGSASDSFRTPGDNELNAPDPGVSDAGVGTDTTDRPPETGPTADAVVTDGMLDAIGDARPELDGAADAEPDGAADAEPDGAADAEPDPDSAVADSAASDGAPHDLAADDE